MNRKKLTRASILLLSAATLLASCGAGGNSNDTVSSPTGAESSSTSSGSSEQPKLPINKEILAKKFNEIVEAKSYRLSKVSLTNEEDEPSFEDTYCFDSYIRLESKGLSHILRPNFEDPSKTSSYEFDNTGKTLELLSIDSKLTGDAYAPLTDLSSFNLLSDYVGKDGKGTFTKDDFLMNVDEYVVNDFGLVYSLACLLNLKERADNEQFVYATLSLENNGDLSFVLVYSTDGFKFTDYAKGTFSDLNSASASAEEAYFKNPSSVNMVEEATLPALQKDAYTFTADIWEHQDSEKWGYNEGINVVAMDLNKIHHTFGRVDHYYDDHYYQKQEDASREVYLSGSNKVESKPTGQNWSSYVYLKDILKANNLMKVGNGRYRYIGSNPFSVFYGLTLAKSLGNQDVEFIDFSVSNGTLTNIEVKFNSYTDPTNFYSKDWYAAHITVQEGADITMPAPLAPSEDGSHDDIAKTLSYFHDSFQLKLYNAKDPASAAYLTYSNVEGSRYLLREEKTLKPGSTTEYSSKRIGYAMNKENKLVQFLYTSQNDVFALSEPEDKTLEDVLNMNLSPDVLKKTVIESQVAYNLRTPIYDLTSSIQGFQHLDSVRPMTFHIFYKNNVSKKPLSYSYRYEYNNGQSKGEEIGEFVGLGDDEIEVDANLAAKVKELTSFSAPSTWEMEENVYPTLLSFFGESTAKLIPYVYEPTLFDGWYAITTNIVNNKPTHVQIYQPDTYVDFTDPTHYMSRFEEKVRAIPGIVEGKDSNGKKTYYVLEGGVYTLGITIGENPKVGIDLYIPD